MPTPTSTNAPLRRALNTPGLAAVTFFCVAGGPFGLEDAVGAAGPQLALLGIVLLPWFWSFPTALMTAELSTAMPEDGGYVVWVEKAFGRFWGFQEGWLSWLCSFADNALYPVMFVDYLAYLRGDMSPTERWLIGASLVLVITWLNIRGIQLVGFMSVIFTLFVLAPFIVMIVLGAPRVETAHWFASSGDASGSVNWALLMSVLLWNTSGWDNAGCCAGEVANPARSYPRAMIVSVIVVTLVYLLPLLVGVSIDTDWAQWKEGEFPKIAAQVGGGWLGTWLTVAGLVTAAGMFNALLCTSSRVPFAMAERRMLPRGLAALHKKHATPWRSIVINSLGVAALIPFSFQELIEVDMFLYAASMILEFAALVWLRIKKPEMTRPYRVPGGTAGAVALSIPPTALCFLSIGLANHATLYVGVAGIALGLLVYRWQS
ncbi:MAG: APC family permease [Deltaproteobacteria bacterium]|nr:APC family permease [Deltaproteobacteria bacterium]